MTKVSIIGAGNVAMLKERWRVKFPMGGTSTPVVYDGAAYFGGWDGNAYAIDAETGEIRWQQKLTSRTISDSECGSCTRLSFLCGCGKRRKQWSRWLRL